MGSLADVTLGDIGRALARYRPVAITVAIILVVLAIAGGPRGRSVNAFSTAPPPAAGSPTTVAAGDEATASTDTTVASDPSSSSSSSFGSSSSFDSSSSSSSDTSDFSSDSSSSPSSDFASAPAPTFDFSDEDGTAASPSAGAEPLTVVAAGWASTGGGTPIGSTGVPEGTLPVAKRIGQVDKYSFVRLEGDQKVLSLAVNADGARTTTGTPGVSICQITEAGWAEATNVPSDAAPDYDEATCVPGDPGDGTTWTFNLVTFASPSDPRGFALVPSGDAVDFQVTFVR